MHHIKNFFKIIVSFYLVTLFSQGCECVNKALRTKNIVPHPSEDPSTKDVQKPNADNRDNRDDLDDLDDHSITVDTPKVPNCDSAPFLSTDLAASKEEIKKQKIEARSKEWMEQYQTKFRKDNEAKLPQERLSENQLQEHLKDVWDAQSVIDEKHLSLPDEKLDVLFPLLKSQEKVEKDIDQICENLSSLLSRAEYMMDLDKRCGIEIKVNPSQPIFKQLITVLEEERNNELLIFYQKIEHEFIRCSSEEKQTYEPHLKNLVHLWESRIKVKKEIRELIPDTLAEEILKAVLARDKKIKSAYPATTVS